MECETVGPVKRLLRATYFSLNGLRAGLRTQAPLRLELLILVLLVPIACLVRSGGVDRALLIGSWMLVIVVEVINSAIETVVDRIGKEHHELSRRAKDLGSAAVFCSIVLAVSVWALILLSH